jgi:hypothetical protein
MSEFIPGRRDVAIQLAELAVARGHRPSVVRSTTAEGFEVPDDVARAYRNGSRPQPARKRKSTVGTDKEAGDG